MNTPALADKEMPFSWTFLSSIYDYRWQLEERRDLFLAVEELYETKSKTLQAEFEEVLKTTDPDDHDDASQSFSMHQEYVEQNLPGIHRAATFIMLYHFLESKLDDICSGVGDELRSDVTLVHLKGSGIERALLFLDVVAKLDLSLLKADLDFTKACRRLRNVVVHAGGHVDPGNKEVTRFVGNETLLRLEHDGVVSWSREFVVKFFDSLEVLFIGIHDAMQDFMRRQGNKGNAYLIGSMGRAPVYGPDSKKLG